MNFALIVPVYNPGSLWSEWCKRYLLQTAKPQYVLFIDSSSDDGCFDFSMIPQAIVVKIPKQEFSHGATRMLGLQYIGDSEFVIYMTQDALLSSNDALLNLIHTFQDPDVSAVFGRQLPHDKSSLLSAHARFYNYPACSYTRKRSDINQFGLKTCFMSNSFAGYRIRDLKGVGGFRNDLILGEDVAIGARLILSGRSIAYNASAQVNHSHEYSILDEFKRYFDIGVFHRQDADVLMNFGGATGEGFIFVKSEIYFLLKNGKYFLIPETCLRTLLKYIGYNLGKNYNRIPKKLIVLFSMHKHYWYNRKKLEVL